MRTKTFAAVSDISELSIIVTGGAGVLGGEISCALAEAGANVAILDREPEMADRWSDRLEASRGQAIVEYCDVLDKEVVGKGSRTCAGQIRKSRLSGQWGRWKQSRSYNLS